MFIAYVADVLLVIVVIAGLSAANLSLSGVNELRVDEGGNLTLPCTGSDEDSQKVYWVHEGRAVDATVLDNSSLLLEHTRRGQAGLYTCIHADTDTTLSQIKVLVQTPPPRLVNVTVHASTILALLRWDVADTGGYPLSHFTAQYRLKHSSQDEPPDEWHRVLPGRINPSSSQVDVYKLEPNSTYLFEVWASNKLGEGEVVQVEATTHDNLEEIELARHLLDGVETFDTRYWVAAVAVVMGTLSILALGTCYALYRECRLPLIIAEGEEVMELVPHIILNPGYHDEGRWSDPDENANDFTTTRLNNNHVVRPFLV